LTASTSPDRLEKPVLARIRSAGGLTAAYGIALHTRREATADFNADGKDDIIWKNSVTG
jgi:hypothetical protein